MRALVAVVVAACAAPAATSPATPRTWQREVATDRGLVVGHARNGVREFLGIPYAAPPVGALRWRPPQPAAAWTTPRDATRRGPACPQPEEGYHRATSEDCLNLNLWTPDGATGDLPVLVWIHGGGFYQGSGGDDLYDGARLARRARAIVVTINYRLGALGFLSQRALAAEQGRDALPAVGLLDQRAALQWVQRNIAAFGGDPAKVTLDGESAGAWSECAQLAMPGSRGLFARAIVQSGACSDALYFTPETANAQGDDLAAKVGCTGGDVAVCLRGKRADELVTALRYRRGLLLLPGVWWGPIVDGVELPRMPLAAIRARRRHAAHARVQGGIGGRARLVRARHVRRGGGRTRHRPLRTADTEGGTDRHRHRRHLPLQCPPGRARRGRARCAGVPLRVDARTRRSAARPRTRRDPRHRPVLPVGHHQLRHRPERGREAAGRARPGSVGPLFAQRRPRPRLAALHRQRRRALRPRPAAVDGRAPRCRRLRLLGFPLSILILPEARSVAKQWCHRLNRDASGFARSAAHAIHGLRRRCWLSNHLRRAPATWPIDPRLGYIVSDKPLPQIGFTGTRHGMTPQQRTAVTALLQDVTQGGEFVAHHGDCVGADAEFHDLCRMEPRSMIVVHPGPLDDLPNQAGCVGDSRHEPRPHMRRNKNIVMASTVMIAAPLELIEQAHGGTWRTIEMARKAKRPLAIAWRDGNVTRERWEPRP